MGRARQGTGLRRAAGALAGLLMGLLPLAAPAQEGIRPMPRPAQLVVIPKARWDFRPEGSRWTLDALDALKAHGQPLVSMVPQDASAWCPGYEDASAPERRAFWVAFLSALAKHESTWRPRAVGGGGQWFGLLQILPSTARLYKCRARSGQALLDGSANLSCAIRIMARTVPRDGVIHAREPRWGGVSADWGPMRSTQKRGEMAAWLRGQEFCQIKSSPRPLPRPAPEALVAGPVRPALRPLPRPAAVALVTRARPAPVLGLE